MAKFTVFSWFKEITFSKRKWEEFSESELSTWNTYMINRILSMNVDFIELINYVQSVKNLKPKEIYNIYIKYIPKKNIYSEYIIPSIKENKHSQENINYLAEYLNCSKKEVKQYLPLIPEKELSDFFNNFTKPTKEKI